jgi:hypothetical protein
MKLNVTKAFGVVLIVSVGATVTLLATPGLGALAAAFTILLVKGLAILQETLEAGKRREKILQELIDGTKRPL